MINEMFMFFYVASIRYVASKVLSLLTTGVSNLQQMLAVLRVSL